MNSSGMQYEKGIINSPSENPTPPWPMLRRKLGIPLVDRVLISHAHIAASTDRYNVVQSGRAALALWNVMTALVIKDGHLVCAPDDLALGIKESSNLR